MEIKRNICKGLLPYMESKAKRGQPLQEKMKTRWTKLKKSLRYIFSTHYSRAMETARDHEEKCSVDNQSNSAFTHKNFDEHKNKIFTDSPQQDSEHQPLPENCAMCLFEKCDISHSTTKKAIFENMRFDSSQFNNCTIKKANFKNCSFFNTQFSNVNFFNVKFEDCKFFSGFSFSLESSEEKHYLPSHFKNCLFFNIEFKQCGLNSSLLYHCAMYKVLFKNSSLTNSLFSQTEFFETTMSQCDLRSLSIYNINKILDLRVDAGKTSTLDKATFFDYKLHYKASHHKQDLYLTSSNLFFAIAEQFHHNNLHSLGGEYFYRAKNMERKSLPPASRVKSFIAFITCGYGERPSFTLLTILAMVFIFAFFYLFAGIMDGNNVLQYSLPALFRTPPLQILADFGKCVFYSITTFTTVGYGNYLPNGSWSMALSSIEMLLGICLCALFTGCIFRKIAR